MTILSRLWNSFMKGVRGIGSYAKKHKILAGIVVLVIIGAGWWGYTTYAKSKAASEYTLSYATEGPLQTTVTDSGQVSAEHQLNLSPQASGEVTEVNVTPGETVTAGTIVAELDLTDPEQAIESAKENLESAQISYQQTLTSSQNGVSSDQTSVNTANTSAANAVSAAYSGLPGISSGLDTTLHALSTLNGYGAEENIIAYANYIDTAQSQEYSTQIQSEYAAATSAYQASLPTYSSYDVTTASPAETEQLDDASLEALQSYSQVLRDSLAFYNYISQQVQVGDKIVPSQLATQISTLTSDLNTVNGDISSITSAETALKNAETSLNQDTQTLSGSDTSLTIQSAQLNLQKAQDALSQAEQDEENYIVRAPFDGTIASVGVKKYDQASSGTAVAVLITTQDYADLSVNEADASKLQVGQPATLTFDALPNVTMNGTVAEVDQVGTVSQGVVTYDVQVGFDGTNSEVKPGMTVQATITTASVSDAVQVPSAAVHTTGNFSYVEVAKVASSTLASTTKAASTTRRTGSSASSTGFGGYGGASTASSTGSFGGGTGFASSSASSSRAFATSATTAALARPITVPVADVTITRVPVTVGISNDTMTQITSGLSRGELVVTGTTAASTKTTAAASAARTTTGFGGAAGGGATFRAGGGGAGVGGAALRGAL